MNPSLRQVVRRQSLIPPGAQILVGVSGGADSVALLCVLSDLAASMNWRLGVAHVHHGLRGKAADDDAVWVRRLAGELGWPVHVRRVRVQALAEAQAVSVEMAARQARRRFFIEQARRHGYGVVALGHTLDDQAETVLLRLTRGAGLTGLKGIEPVRQEGGLDWVHPLLGVRKAELQAWLRRRGQVWREDASNADAVYRRNRVRTELLPLLRERFNPSVDAALARTALLLQADEAVLRELAEQDGALCIEDDGAALSLAAWRGLPLARRRRVLLQWLYGGGLSEQAVTYDALARIERLAAGRAGSGRIELGAGMSVQRVYERLVIGSDDDLQGAALGPAAAVSASVPRIKLARPGETVWAEDGWHIVVRPIKGFAVPANEAVGRWPAEAYVGRAAVGRAAFYVRYWQDGDRFAPAGMQGSCKLQDLWVDRKVPAAMRRRIPLLVCRDEIVWIPGVGVARDWRVAGPEAAAWHLRIARQPA
jgi:tRNA(Ile)-lysidine synthase